MRSFLVVMALGSVAAAGTVKGRVVEGGSRVAEFAVRLDNQLPVAVADGDGRFELDDVDDGTHQLTLIGWAFRTKYVDVTVKGATSTGTIVVEPGRRLFGHVVDKDQQPVAGATVLAYEDPPNSIGSALELMTNGVRVATSSADGTYVISGLPDDAALRVEAVDGERRSIEQLPAPLSSGGIELVVARTGTVVGTVVNHRKLASPVVRATPVGPTGRPLIGGINPKGHFELALPAGVYDLTLDEENQPPLQVVVVENRTNKVELVAPTSHAELVVTSPGCTTTTLLGARPHEATPRTEIGIEPCENDRARFAHLAPGEYRVCVDAAEAGCLPVTIRASPRVQHTRIDVAKPVDPSTIETDVFDVESP